MRRFETRLVLLCDVCRSSAVVDAPNPLSAEKDAIRRGWVRANHPETGREVDVCPHCKARGGAEVFRIRRVFSAESARERGCSECQRRGPTLNPDLPICAGRNTTCSGWSVDARDLKPAISPRD